MNTPQWGRTRQLSNHHEDLAVAERREDGFEAQQPYRGVKYPWRCRCHGCGTITSPTFGSILAGQSGCRRCAALRAAAARREDLDRAVASMREAASTLWSRTRRPDALAVPLCHLRPHLQPYPVLPPNRAGP